jgi:hypothetical protein
MMLSPDQGAGPTQPIPRPDGGPVLLSLPSVRNDGRLLNPFLGYRETGSSAELKSEAGRRSLHRCSAMTVSPPFSDRVLRVPLSSGAPRRLLAGKKLFAIRHDKYSSK